MKQSSEHLTVEQREAIINRLNDQQYQFINSQRRKRLRSWFQTELLEESIQYELIDYRVNKFYPQNLPEHNLYCDCGKLLKRQYVVRSLETGEIKKLGITHFTQHLKIPDAVARRVKLGVQEINYWLDSILIPIMLNENYHSLFSFNQVKKTIEKLLPHPRFKVIEGLITLDLPLSDELEDDYQAAVETGNNYLKTVRKLPILLNQVKFQKLNQVKFQTLIKNRYRKLTLGEGIDLKELKFYLNAHSHEIKINENSVELLANGIKEYSFRLVNKRLYLIKRYDGKPY